MAERRRARRRNGLPAPIRRVATPRADDEKEIRRWTQRIQKARKLRQEWAQEYQVETLARMFTGTGLGEEDWDSDLLQINRVWPTVKAQMPGLIAQAPKPFIRPVGPGAGAVSAQQSAALESTLTAIAKQDDHLVQEALYALQQSFWAIGVLKTLYDPTLKRNPQAGEPIWETDEAGGPVFDAVTGQRKPLMDPETMAPMTEPRRIVDDEVYRWQWVNWHNMLLPDEGPAMLRWSWVGEEIEVPLDEAKDDERFPQALRNQLRATEKPRAAGDSAPPTALAQRDEDQMVWYVELWDMKNARHLVFAEGQPFSATHFLLEEETPDGVEDHPYAILPGYTPITDPDPSPWPMPHIWNWLTLQREYTHGRQQMHNAARRSARKIFYQEGTFADEDEAHAALQSPQDMQAVKVQDITRPPITVADPSHPPDLAQHLLATEADWRNVTGMPGERLGSPTADTATQAMLTDRSATLREGAMKMAVNLWMGGAYRKMAQLVRATLTLGMSVKIRDWTDAEVQDAIRRIFGPMAAGAMQDMPGLKELLIQRYGREKWMPVSRETLNFEADIGIVPGSARARTPESDRQQTLLFLKTLAEVGAVMPQLLTSRRFVSHLGDLFELGDELMVDELVLKVQQGIQSGMLGQRPGAGGGTSQPSPAQVQGQPMMASRLQTALTNGGF